MALFNKLFQSHKRKNGQTTETSARSKPQTYKLHQNENDSFFPFASEQVRIILYRECDWTGRRLLFDSSAIQKVKIGNSEELLKTNGKISSNGRTPARNYIEVSSDGYGYVYKQPTTDSNSIGEMIFGSVAMSFKGTSLKVHWLPDPKRILCSQVFLSPTQPRASFSRATNSNRTSFDSTNCDLGSFDTNSMNLFTLSLSLCVSDNLNQLTDKITTEDATIPLDVPASSTVIEENADLDRSYAYSGCDSGYCGTDVWTTASGSSYYQRSARSSIASVFSTDPSGTSSRKLSIDSAILVDAALNGRITDGCLQRRIRRNMSTSFENNYSGNDFIGYFSDNRKQNSKSNTGMNNNTNNNLGVPIARRFSDQSESRSNPEMMRKRKGSSKDSLRPPAPHFSSYTPKPKSARRSKIGLAVCITFSKATEDEMQLFCSEHIALLESMLCRLRAVAETAYVNHKEFHQVMLHAWFSATAWIADLFTAPRIKEPVWITLSSGSTEKPHSVAKHFMSELCWLLNCADTKDTNFFVSTLLTAILTNHLGWVETVAPMITNSHKTRSFALHQNQATMAEISKFHPYNVLWAQLGDLYGAIGNPSKLSKTIVCGTQSISINKVLNILTYFIRCGEIKRIKSTKFIEKDVIDDIIIDNENQKKFAQNNNDVEDGVAVIESVKVIKPKGLSRTKTFVKDLTTAIDSDEDTSKKNDIPNVLAFRDSRFVQQELRIGNFQMDTGIEMNIEQKLNIQNYKIRESPNTYVKLMVTSPENDKFECEAAAEAIDYVLKRAEPYVQESKSQSLGELITANSIGGERENENKTIKLLWGIEPVKEGISVDQWQQIEKNLAKTIETEFSNRKTDFISTARNTELKRSLSFNNKSDRVRKARIVRKIEQNGTNTVPDACNLDKNLKLSSHASLSDLITANSMGASGRLQWGIEPVKESVCLEEEIYFEMAQKRIEKDHDFNLKPGNVVFVLGDNEVLSGLRSAPPSPVPSLCDESPSIETKPIKTEQNKQTELQTSLAIPSVSSTLNAVTTNGKPEKTKKKCTHKKHSGVKFNFEQYPQIVTNYMKNKNLDITSYDFLEKGLKLEQENMFNYGASSTSVLPMMATPDEIEEDEEEECECCANTFRVLQTPSNATELEFSNDDSSYPVPTTKSIITATCENGQNVINHLNENLNVVAKSDKMMMVNGNELVERKNADQTDESTEMQRKANYIELIKLPIPKTKILNETKKEFNKMGPGFVPSLFIGITDHYIPDMVLQGTTAPQSSWEPILIQNLALASHCATIEQAPTENIAIIANVDKWDVKLLSSQTYALPGGRSASTPIGMSQLVSTMLETVHAMWLSGTSAYQCMSFMESKLQEMYLHSETLAAFLLATEFCSLNSVTSALNLSANDVPLLLSVASIHSPQVTKKYGISFR